mmetsp:Transcript_11160/g.30856  ORF Transcript_11160/g.30856 Transcript_11160/m.30856 type:complete len:222 (+) Transcript_11160:1010-1675(+)
MHRGRGTLDTEARQETEGTRANLEHAPSRSEVTNGSPVRVNSSDVVHQGTVVEVGGDLILQSAVQTMCASLLQNLAPDVVRDDGHAGRVQHTKTNSVAVPILRPQVLLEKRNSPEWLSCFVLLCYHFKLPQAKLSVFRCPAHLPDDRNFGQGDWKGRVCRLSRLRVKSQEKFLVALKVHECPELALRDHLILTYQSDRGFQAYSSTFAQGLVADDVASRQV